MAASAATGLAKQITGSLAARDVVITKVSMMLAEDMPPDRCLEVGRTLGRIEGATAWWRGDWSLQAARLHKAYGELKAQAEQTGIDYDALHQARTVAGAFGFVRRHPNLFWEHHKAVLGFPADEQDQLLDLAEKQGWSVQGLRAEVRRRKKPATLPLPAGRYRVIYADPPWSYDNSGFDQSAAQQYPTMTTDEVCDLDVASLVGDGSVLFLWATSPLLPDALRVMEAWGFEYKACMVWVKDRAPGMGWFLNAKHELLLIGTHGDGVHPAEKTDSVIVAPVHEHSRKPDAFAEAIEAMYEGPRIELFARRQRPGWAVWGNEV